MIVSHVVKKILHSISGHSACLRTVRGGFYSEIVENCHGLIKVTVPQCLYSIWNVTFGKLFKNIVLQNEKFQQILDVTMKTFVRH